MHGGTPRKESKKWRQRYLKEEGEFVEEWRTQLPTGEKGRWYTPLKKDIPFVSYEEWLEQHKDSPSPRKTPKLLKSVKGYKNWEAMFGEFYDPMATTEFPPETLEMFENLPKPALFEVMLNLDRRQLQLLCISSRKANKICKERRFRTEYNKKHYILFSGKLRKIEETPNRMRLRDEKNNVLVLSFYANTVETIVYIPRDRTSYIPKMSKELSKLVEDEQAGIIVNSKGEFDIVGWFVDYENVDLNDFDLNENDIVWGFLKSIGREKWYEEENTFWFFSTKTAKEFVDIVENAVKEVSLNLSFENIKNKAHYTDPN